MVSDFNILRLAERFRSAIELTPKSDLPIGFAEFPAGSCADASIILGAFLFDRGFGEFELTRGSRGRMDDDNWGTHGWLTQGELVIDITADQFADIDKAVIVSRDSKWHNQFSIVGTNIAHFNTYDSHTSGSLGDAYRKVVSTLNAT